MNPDDRDLLILELADEGWPSDDIAAFLDVTAAYIAALLVGVVMAEREGALQ